MKKPICVHVANDIEYTRHNLPGYLLDCIKDLNEPKPPVKKAKKGNMYKRLKKKCDQFRQENY